MGQKHGNPGGQFSMTSVIKSGKSICLEDSFFRCMQAGVGGLILSAAATYAKSQIRCNCVAPGLVSHQAH